MNFFNIFYVEDIISNDTLWQWKNNAREDGHGISVISLRRFYGWLSVNNQH